MQLKQNRRDCYDDGYEDGLDHPYDHERGSACSEYGRAYHNGFIAGCLSIPIEIIFVPVFGANNNATIRCFVPDINIGLGFSQWF